MITRNIISLAILGSVIFSATAPIDAQAVERNPAMRTQMKTLVHDAYPYKEGELDWASEKFNDEAGKMIYDVALVDALKEACGGAVKYATVQKIDSKFVAATGVSPIDWHDADASNKEPMAAAVRKAAAELVAGSGGCKQAQLRELRKSLASTAEDASSSLNAILAQAKSSKIKPNNEALAMGKRAAKEAKRIRILHGASSGFDKAATQALIDEDKQQQMLQQQQFQQQIPPQ